MPARVEYRLGSIFDEDCDILVIPSSAGGTVTPSMAEQLRKEGIAFPPAAPWGSVTYMRSPSPYYGALAYAATLRGQEAAPEIVKLIGQHLGTLAAEHRARRISAPLLGAGAGDLAPAAAAEAVASGFLETAPVTAVLTISIRDPWTYEAVTGKTGEKTGNESPATSRPRPPAPAGPAPPAEPQVPPLGRVIETTAGPAPPAEPEDHAIPVAELRQFVVAATASDRVPKRTRVFISYSHADAEWLERLKKHLRPLERDGALVWDDTRIKAGDRWREEIREALAETRVAILLISADFMASDFITTDELPPLLRAAKEDGARILPVIISPSRFGRTEGLSQFQAVNDPQKPLVQLRRGNREKVLDAVARAVEDALKD